jgi:OOP family OmpA-OmpF porin
MFEKANKKLVAKLAPVGLAVALSVGSVHAGGHGGQGTWTTSGGGGVVFNGYGECWNTVGGINEFPQCGDKMPEPKPMDADGDGVVDAKDQCPNTPKGVAVDANGCPKDSDGDGVPDYKDDCPGTRKGALVNTFGCEIADDITINTTTDHFDFDSAELKPAMMKALDDVVNTLKGTRGEERVEVVGHTDSTGPEAYNQGLSERRAQSAADYMSSKGIKDISVKGMGESAPVADNGTREGRAKNRRVEIRTK